MWVPQYKSVKGPILWTPLMVKPCFSKMVQQNEFCFFLRCNQCIKMLHLSYQTALSDAFHFSPCKGGPLWVRAVISTTMPRRRIGQKRFFKLFYWTLGYFPYI